METYHRKVERRQLPSLQVTNTKLENDISAFEDKVSGHFTI